MKTNTIIFFSLLAMCFSAPAYAEETPIQIVLNATYHGEEVADVKDGQSWIAITESNGAYTAKQVTISVKTVKDDVIDPEIGPFTGKAITSDPSAVFLIRGMALKEGMPIKTYSSEAKSDESTESIEINGGLWPVRLQRKNGPTSSDREHGMKDSYALIGKVGAEEVTLFTQAISIDSHPMLLWAGDVNSDGQPDFLIDLNRFNASVPTLFLSNVTKNTLTYHKVAERFSGGC